MKRAYILASASPRRREICDLLGLKYTVCPAKSELPADEALSAEEAILQVARGKAEEVAAQYPNEWVLGADTAVVVDGEILGKPTDEEDAKAMLRRIAGRSHSVITAVWVCGEGFNTGFADRAEVTFFPMTEQEIEDYVATNEPMDKAGAYAVQGCGARYIQGIHGDFYTVMGLPAGRLYRFLHK
jgi:septum formation protein